MGFIFMICKTNILTYYQILHPFHLFKLIFIFFFNNIHLLTKFENVQQLMNELDNIKYE